jgi:hypothetical protein
LHPRETSWASTVNFDGQRSRPEPHFRITDLHVNFTSLGNAGMRQTSEHFFQRCNYAHDVVAAALVRASCSGPSLILAAELRNLSAKAQKQLSAMALMADAQISAIETGDGPQMVIVFIRYDSAWQDMTSFEVISWTTRESARTTNLLEYKGCSGES